MPRFVPAPHTDVLAFGKVLKMAVQSLAHRRAQPATTVTPVTLKPVREEARRRGRPECAGEVFLFTYYVSGEMLGKSVFICSCILQKLCEIECTSQVWVFLFFGLFFGMCP